MSEQLDVRIVELEPLRVLSFDAYGEQPEYLALDRLVGWLGEKGLLEDGTAHRIFGFNNPGPAPDRPHYGYEFWLEVGPDVAGDEATPVKQFAGGRFAVARCQGVANITATWQRLQDWQQESGYLQGGQQCLEEHIGPPEQVAPEALLLDLYLPVR